MVSDTGLSEKGVSGGASDTSLTPAACLTSRHRPMCLTPGASDTSVPDIGACLTSCRLPSVSDTAPPRASDTSVPLAPVCLTPAC
jgi:hypothetical protein